MTNITFPKTNLVSCVFSLRQNHNVESSQYDEYDMRVDTTRLKQYTYRLPKCLQGFVTTGNYVLVHCQTGYQAAKVVAVDVLTSFEDSTFAPVVCKLDLDSYIAEVERTKQLKSMKIKIDAEKKRLESMVTYELIAEKHPEFKEMLETFKALGGEF